MNGNKEPKRKERSGLIKLFRDALDDALEADPVQHIRDGYQKAFDNYEDDQLKVSFREEAPGGDPVQHIRDTYRRILDDEYNGKEDQAEPQKEKNKYGSADPFQRIRSGYQQMLEGYDQKYLESQKKKCEGLPWWKKFFGIN
jgi:hypothetical protein